MSGITGIFAFNQVGGFYMINLAKSIDAMVLRGPDVRGSFVGNDLVALGYRGYAEKEGSYRGKQPFTEPAERYTIVSDADVHCVRKLKILLERNGQQFISGVPAEVILLGYMQLGQEVVQNLEGGFACCIYDATEKSMFIACDPYGIKHIFYFQDEDKFIFATEMKALLAYNIPRNEDFSAMLEFTQLNFIAGKHTFFNSINKLEPAQGIFVKDKQLQVRKYAIHKERKTPTYEQAKTELHLLLKNAVEDFIEEEKSVGALLDGSLENSILVHIASGTSANFRTYSLQLRKESKKVSTMEKLASALSSDHTTFYLSPDEVQAAAKEYLKNLDAPIAGMELLYDAILFKKIQGKVKTILSPLGANTLLGGTKYYSLEYLLKKNESRIATFKNYYRLLSLFLPDKPFSLIHLLRESKINAEQRFWRQFNGENTSWLNQLWNEPLLEKAEPLLTQRRLQLGEPYFGKKGIEPLFHANSQISLPDKDLLALDASASGTGMKTLLPFLTHELWAFASCLPVVWKIDGSNHSKILQDTYKPLLPAKALELGNNFSMQSTHDWMLEALWPMMLEDDLLDRSYLHEQGLFQAEQVKKMTTRGPGNHLVHQNRVVWNLLVFQHWYKKFIKK